MGLPQGTEKELRVRDQHVWCLVHLSFGNSFQLGGVSGDASGTGEPGRCAPVWTGTNVLVQSTVMKKQVQGTVLLWPRQRVLGHSLSWKQTSEEGALAPPGHLNIIVCFLSPLK